MATPEGSVGDVFHPGGRLRLDCFRDEALEALRESLRLARDTRWDSVRTPHVFMGLLAVADASVRDWGQRLENDLSVLLGQFQELFHQEQGEIEAFLVLNREFLSDNVILLLRNAYTRAREHGRCKVTSIDLLISLLTVPRSIVATYFEYTGESAARLTELAEIAELASGENRG
jgi:ATP-dependent Clp protease ATP-binding subunit ClpA